MKSIIWLLIAISWNAGLQETAADLSSFEPLLKTAEFWLPSQFGNIKHSAFNKRKNTLIFFFTKIRKIPTNDRLGAIAQDRTVIRFS